MGSDHESWMAQMACEARADPRTADELVSAALTAPDEEARWDAVSPLQRRGSREVIDAALGLCASRCAIERALGADILGQSRVAERAYAEESLAVLLALAGSDADAGVFQSACLALGHHRDARAVPVLVPLATHPSADVRFGVASSLATHDDPSAIAALIALSADPDAEVRDYATFGLGSMTELDTPELRDALFRRSDDPDDDARGEALVGLALRRDERVFGPLLRELGRDPDRCDGYAREAAEKLADSRLLPALLRLQALASDGRFDRAVGRCSAPAGAES